MPMPITNQLRCSILVTQYATVVTYSTSSAEVAASCVAALVDVIGGEVDAVVCWVGMVTGSGIVVGGGVGGGGVVGGGSEKMHNIE